MNFRAMATVALMLWIAMVPGRGVAQESDASVPVDQPGVCFECHSNIAQAGKLPQVHGPFASGECSSCHNPHASRHVGLLRDEVDQLCTGCHEDVAEARRRPVTHPPVEQGECGTCHEPHGGQYADLLVQPQSTLCAGCHSEVSGWRERAFVHSPVGRGDCARCHDVHGSENGQLLVQAIPELCLECHQNGPGFARAHPEPAIRRSDCTACHDPHASDLSGLLRRNQHAPFAGGDCRACHASTSGAGAFALAAPVEELCSKCHWEAKSFQENRYRHVLGDEQSCVHCHEPHAADGEKLLRGNQVALCLRCHFNEPERAPKAKNVTHDGIDCTNCHLPHGADNATYLTSEGVDLCVRCHDGAHHSSHPVGPEIIDPRTQESVTCRSCHQLHGAPFEKYLPLDPSMDLCIQCHRR